MKRGATGTVLLIVNADDYNTDRERNRGIIESARRGIVTSVTVIANATENAESLRDLGAAVGNACGVHLNLTKGRPLAPDVPTLTDDRGLFFPKKWAWARALAGRYKSNEVKRELAAQIESLASLGMKPDHLDGNNHIHVFPGIRNVVAGLARDFGISAVRLPREPFVRFGQCWEPAASVKWLIGLLSLGAAREFRRCGLRSPDFFAGIQFPRLSDVASLKRFVAHLSPGVTELMCHPGYASAGNVFSSEERERELRALTDPSLRDDCARHGVRLSSFGEALP